MIAALAAGMIGIVGAGDDQSGLPDDRQCEHTRPNRPGEQLMHIADARARYQLPTEESLDDRGVVTRAASVKFRSDTGGIVLVEEPLWSKHFRQHPRLARHHEHTGAGRHQDKASTPARVLHGELLRQRPAPGVTQHIHRTPVTELLQEPAEGRSEVRKAIR